MPTQIRRGFNFVFWFDKASIAIASVLAISACVWVLAYTPAETLWLSDILKLVAVILGSAAVIRWLPVKVMNYIVVSRYNKWSAQQGTSSPATAISELDAVKTELDIYKQFFEDVYLYARSYPNWKAQQEFRNIMAQCDTPLPAHQDAPKLTKAQYVDAYLGRVVDATAMVLEKCPSAAQGKDLHFWSREELTQARATVI